MQPPRPRKHYIYAGIAALFGVFVLVMIGFSIIYSGKAYPGVSVDGMYAGGMTRQAIGQRLQAQAKTYNTQQIPVKYGQTILQVPVSALEVEYATAASNTALKYGRTGSLAAQWHNRLRALFGRETNIAAYQYDRSKLTPFVDQVDGDVNQPVANASLGFENNEVTVVPAQVGARLDRGLLTEQIEAQLGKMGNALVVADVYPINPSVSDKILNAAKHQADVYATAPLTVNVAGQRQTIDQNTILSWVDVTAPGVRTELPLNALHNFYPNLTSSGIDLTVDRNRVSAFVAQLAGTLSKEPKNAVLAMQNGVLTVVVPSKPGVVVDQAKSTQQIIDALTRPVSQRTIGLAATTKAAEVNENNLDSLGIKEQLSEGKTFFPGSSSDRMINVTTGAKRFNDVLLKPGETFSFGKILGDVGPAQGYVPELVILGDHEEKQYGGGLCQVASTAYRAALLAGLPINERHNHSFAVSYYTAPYGVPGVDATIYYPEVDLKFTNDTGHYILIQTTMAGQTLAFDFFGTKTKTGEIRGPEFVSGTTDAKQPSHTVFYRDVKDLSGNVIKTNQVDTYYESSTKFSTIKQFN